ncbi:M6 family metalloprotease domain-containing protein [Myxococcus xanthus]|uniref:Protease n=1 Tax=Myxococcus xanthus TaxID=34 RepID=A0AAE6FZT8_MYXXA|nr:M6 family metalloprotease domain-containing protein [Myxococcus xanthus]QDE68222.1 protease [Myxococcus xanthus]QDE75499.1 protease [Myxococcus xanthus]QDE97074.1 protease [Myxococcus xanthus]QDF04621.1 protease [Myxococcus xanthus]
MKERFQGIQAVSESLFGRRLLLRETHAMGLNDGLIIPGSYFPLGTGPNRVRNFALERQPLRGQVRVIVVLVDFEDRPMNRSRQQFEDLFFSQGKSPTGSVREYFAEASHGLVDIVGQVVGPYRMPLKLAQYAGGGSGTDNPEPNARTMARHAAEAAASVDFAPYDNDGNGFVDAFIVVHSGGGAEQTGSAGDIWSHKWVLFGGEHNAQGAKIFGYLTIPEDAKIGVCCHEIGHLVFGWPDLYDADGTSEGLGNWCLMAGGSWNNNGDVPAHPSAWCKARQGWVSIVNYTANRSVNFTDVKTEHSVHRLWKNGVPGSEYFLVENRQQNQYDRFLPGSGLLVYHVDESIPDNTNEVHPRVRLVQADALEDLDRAVNRGDDGDPFPGSSGNSRFEFGTRPSSRAYSGRDSCVSISDISPSGMSMTAHVEVSRAQKTRDVLQQLVNDWPE